MSASEQLVNSGIAAASHEEDDIQQHNVGVISKVGEVEKISQPTGGRVHQKMPKNPIADFLCRFTRIDSFEYLTTANRGDVTLFQPITQFFANPTVASKTAQYAYIRFDMELRFVTAVPAGAYGAYGVSVVMHGGTQKYPLQWQNCLQVKESAIIDLSASSDVVMRVPFIYFYDYMRIDNLLDLFEIQFTCLEPLTKTFGDATIVGNTKIFARLVEGYDMVVPYHQSGFDDAVSSVNTAVEGAFGDKLSGLANSASEVASTIGNSVPVLKPLTEPVSYVASTASKILSWFGLTRTAAQQTPTVVTWRNFSNVANVDVDDTSEVAGLFASNSLAMDPETSGDTSETDECAFEYLFSRPVLIAAFDWPMSAVQDAVLGTIPVSPFYTTTGSDVEAWNLTTAGYVGFPFSHWRGDMIYDVYIPRSKFHRGTLQVAWLPEDPGGTNLTNITLNTILDIGDYTMFSLRVGYARERPVLDCQLISPVYPPIIPYESSCNGSLSFIVQNPLVAAQAGSDVSILVFARAAENMQFMHLRDNFPYLDDLVINPHTMRNTVQVVLQSGAVGDDVGSKMEMDLVPSSGPYPIAKILAGEDIRSIRGLLQKPCWMPFDASTDGTSTFNGANEEALTLSVSHFPPTPYSNGNHTSGSLAPFSHAGYYSALFVGIAGSTRYKILGIHNIGGGAWVAQAYPLARPYTPGNTYLNTGAISFLSPLQQLTWQGAEFTVPYYGTQKYYSPRTVAGTADEIPRDALVVGCRGYNSAIPVYFQYFQSCAPDTRVNYFRWTPRLFIRPEPDGNAIQWPVNQFRIV